MIECFTAADGIEVISSSADIPTLGSLAINAYLLTGGEPLLVDTGTVVGSTDFMTALSSIMDPAALRWIWLTHTDFDHIGALWPLLEENSEVKVITSFLGVGIMSLSATPLPMDRVRLVNPGQTVSVGHRRLTAFRPPVFDNPITAGFFDETSGALFSSDCFGALLPSVPHDARDLDPADLRSGQIRWATIDSSWVHDVDRSAFTARLQGFRAMKPTVVCSSHLPPAPGAMLPDLIDALAQVPDAPRFQGLDQSDLDALLAAVPAPV